MKTKRTRYTEEEFKLAASQVYSISKLIEKLGLIPVGGNYKTMHKKIAEWGVDTSHFTGQGWNKGKVVPKEGTPLDEILSGKHPYFSTHGLRKKLLKAGVFEHKCSCCDNTEWNGVPIPLELDHIDGNNTNHLLSNLRMLCPNCHAQTDTYRGKNKSEGGASLRMKERQSKDLLCQPSYEYLPASKEPKAYSIKDTMCEYKAVSCEMCCNFLRKKSKRFCSQECAHKATLKVKWDDFDIVKMVEIDKIPMVRIGKLLNVSDNAVRKHYLKLIAKRI